MLCSSWRVLNPQMLKCLWRLHCDLVQSPCWSLLCDLNCAQMKCAKPWCHIVSFFGLHDTGIAVRKHLSMQDADVDLEGLDWIVCHSGADIWHGQQDGQWNADDQWEQLIDFRSAALAYPSSAQSFGHLQTGYIHPARCKHHPEMLHPCGKKHCLVHHQDKDAVESHSKEDAVLS